MIFGLLVQRWCFGYCSCHCQELQSTSTASCQFSVLSLKNDWTWILHSKADTGCRWALLWFLQSSHVAFISAPAGIHLSQLAWLWRMLAPTLVLFGPWHMKMVYKQYCSLLCSTKQWLTAWVRWARAAAHDCTAQWTSKACKQVQAVSSQTKLQLECLCDFRCNCRNGQAF